MTSNEGAAPSGQDGPPTRPLFEQTLSDSEQTLADGDQARSDADQASADQDQQASDLDQAAADREQDGRMGSRRRVQGRPGGAPQGDRQAPHGSRTARAYDGRAARRRRGTRPRGPSPRPRGGGARPRRRRSRGGRPGGGCAESALQRLAALRARAVHDRTRAAADRAAAAADRAAAAEDRARAMIELRHAYHDDLTGALRREMGEVALQHEVDRARRGDNRLVVAFVDVDKLKELNDRGATPRGTRCSRPWSPPCATAAIVRPRRPLRRRRVRLRALRRRRGGGDRAVRQIKEELAASTTTPASASAWSSCGRTRRLDDLIVRGDAALYAAKGRRRDEPVPSMQT